MLSLFVESPRGIIVFLGACAELGRLPFVKLADFCSFLLLQSSFFFDTSRAYITAGVIHITAVNKHSDPTGLIDSVFPLQRTVHTYHERP